MSCGGGEFRQPRQPLTRQHLRAAATRRCGRGASRRCGDGFRDSVRDGVGPPRTSRRLQPVPAVQHGHRRPVGGGARGVCRFSRLMSSPIDSDLRFVRWGAISFSHQVVGFLKPGPVLDCQRGRSVHRRLTSAPPLARLTVSVYPSAGPRHRHETEKPTRDRHETEKPTPNLSSYMPKRSWSKTRSCGGSLTSGVLLPPITGPYASWRTRRNRASDAEATWRTDAWKRPDGVGGSFRHVTRPVICGPDSWCADRGLRAREAVNLRRSGNDRGRGHVQPWVVRCPQQARENR